jgi:hypothetical protein
MTTAHLPLLLLLIYLQPEEQHRGHVQQWSHSAGQ